MIAGLAIEEWILPYHTVGMQLYNHLLPPTTVPASAFLSRKLLQVLNWDTVWETSASGSVMWGQSLHRMVTDSVSYPSLCLQHRNQSLAGDLYSYVYRLPPERLRPSLLLLGFWFHFSRTPAMLSVSGAGDWTFLRGPFMLFPAVCLSTALITSLINSLLTTIHLNVPLNPNLMPLSIEKRIKVFKEFRERSRCPVATASRGLCPPIAQANLKDSLFWEGLAALCN